ncbi:MAG: orotidine-5'-phosphate decarboxylase [Clostridiales bacterium]|nr:orotidine-5'-phosphate decarboxylase [Clostridiales bacterium]
MIDRLIEKIDKTGNPSVVGLDPAYEMIPGKIKKEMLDSYGKTPKAVAEMFIAFNKGLIDGLHDIVPAAKPQIAMYEKYGLEGLRAYVETTRYAKEKGMIVIGDIKRGDISTTAAAYAAHIGMTAIEGDVFDLWNEDAVTLNPYMGFDGIEPFIKPCNEFDKGVFILVKTSNPSSADLQDLDASGAPLYEKAAALVGEWGKLAMGSMGYSRVGAVVGATFKEQGERLRKVMPSTFFLVPGYGAQGGKGSDIKGFFGSGRRGCIVNSSRGIIAAYKKDPVYGDGDFAEAARAAALKMKEDITG